MKKFIAVVLALVLCMSLCAFASAATTEAMSNTLTVKVLSYTVKQDSADGSIAKSEAVKNVLQVSNEQGRDTKWTVEIDGTEIAAKPVGSSVTITSADVLGVVTTTKTAKIKVTAKTVGGNGTYYADANSVTLDIKVVYAGEQIEEENKPDQKQTEGDFTCTIETVGGPFYDGDVINVKATANISDSLKAVAGNNVTYKFYAMDKNGEITASLVSTGNAAAAYSFGVVADNDYKFWCVATLSF